MSINQNFRQIVIGIRHLPERVKVLYEDYTVRRLDIKKKATLKGHIKSLREQGDSHVGKS